MAPETLAQHEQDAPHLQIYGNSGAIRTLFEQTVDKALSVDVSVPPSAELPDPTKVEVAYVY